MEFFSPPFFGFGLVPSSVDQGIVWREEGLLEAGKGVFSPENH